MTLIELIFAYRDIVRLQGRIAGQKFLEGTCRKSIWRDIRDSVSDSGDLLDGFGKVIQG